MANELRGALEITPIGSVGTVPEFDARPQILRAPDGFFGWGTDLDMSADGITIVYGSLDGNFVKTYDWVDPAWVKRGSTLTQGVGDFGCGVSIANDGTEMLVADSRAANGGTINAGALYRYSVSGTAWSLDDTYLGVGAANTGLGVAMDTSDDLGICIAGTWNNTVETYDWGGGPWTKRASILSAPASAHGTVAAGSFGRNLTCSGDGTRFATTYRVDGYTTDIFIISVFDWGGSSWALVGAEIISPGGTDDETCVGIYLSDDGLRLFSIWNDANNAFSGAGNIHVYDWVNPNWVLDAAAGAAYDPVTDWNDITDRAGLWVAADESLTALQTGDNPDIGFYALVNNLTGDCIQKVLDKSNIGIVGTYCADITPPSTLTLPPNIPTPPPVNLGSPPQPNNVNCEVTAYYTAYNITAQLVSDNPAYGEWLDDNYHKINFDSGVCQ